MSAINVNKYLNEDQGGIDCALVAACRVGNLELVEFLCLSDKLKYRANITAQNHEAFRLACRNDYLPVVKFLMNDDIHGQKINLYADKNLGIAYALRHANLNILQYLHTDPQLIKKQNYYRITDEIAIENFYAQCTKIEIGNEAPIEKRYKTGKWFFSLPAVQRIKNRKEFKVKLFNRLINDYYGDSEQGRKNFKELAAFLIFDPDLDLMLSHANEAYEQNYKLYESEFSFFRERTTSTHKIVLELFELKKEKKELESLIPEKTDGPRKFKV